MACTGPGDGGRELDSVARLVDLSETAPMPRIDGARPPLVKPPRPRPDPGGLYPEPASPRPVTAELPAALDAMFTAADADGDPEPETAPPPSKSPRYAVLAGVVIVALAGFGTWLLWPGSNGGSTGRPAEVPAAPSRTSSAPPAVATITASPAPPPATDQVDHTTVRTTEDQPEPERTGRAKPPTSSQDPVSEAFSSAVSSYLQQWSSRHEPPRPRHRG